MARMHYPTDLSTQEWQGISALFAVNYGKGGRPVKHSKRKILNAIFYVLRTGIKRPPAGFGYMKIRLKNYGLR